MLEIKSQTLSAPLSQNRLFQHCVTYETVRLLGGERLLKAANVASIVESVCKVFHEINEDTVEPILKHVLHILYAAQFLRGHREAKRHILVSIMRALVRFAFSPTDKVMTAGPPLLIRFLESDGMAFMDQYVDGNDVLKEPVTSLCKLHVTEAVFSPQNNNNKTTASDIWSQPRPPTPPMSLHEKRNKPMHQHRRRMSFYASTGPRQTPDRQPSETKSSWFRRMFVCCRPTEPSIP